ncbi:MAG: rod shape-determining protein MreC [Ignavibacteriota bacterium]|nr:rod shape-determining protein MreC [Ignavibacteriota bacterium]
MKKLGQLILNIKEYLILSVLIVFSLAFLFSNDNTQVRFLRAVAVGMFGTVQSGISSIPNVFELQQENKMLRENNIRLSNEVSGLKESKLENIRLTRSLSFKESTGLGLVSANVVNKSLIQTRNTITLNVGENDSVYINMPVITDAGLVGRIVSTSKNYSIAQILLNKDLRVTVKVQRSRVDGILSYDGVSSLTATNIPKNADVVVGDVIITSEYSNLFPSGLPIGTVTETGNLDNLFKKIEITPLVNFLSLENVFVLKYLVNKERYFLEKSYQSPKK